jgi:hypothetical protein
MCAHAQLRDESVDILAKRMPTEVGCLFLIYLICVQTRSRICFVSASGNGT